MRHGRSYRLDEEKYIVLCNFQVAAFNGKEPSKLVMKIEAAFCTSYVRNNLILLPDV